MLRTVRDLAALAALSADWTDGPPLQVAEGLADLLLRTLGLDFAYLRLHLGQVDGHELEVARAIHQPTTEAQTREIGKALAHWLDRAGTNEVRSVTNPLGSGTVRVIVVPIGRDGEEGVLVAGSQQAGFPGEEDRLLLNVVAKQAAIALQYRRAEEARKRLLRERDELLARQQLQFERMPIACIVFDPQFRIIDWNPAAEKIFGYRREEVVGKNGDLLLVPPSSREYAQKIHRRLASGDMIAHATSENVTRDGHIILCEWHNTPLRDADGEVTAILAMAQDVTERTQTEEKLGRSESLLAEAQHLAHIGSWNWDIVSNKSFWSDEHYRIFGLRPQEMAMTYERFLSLVHPDDRVIVQNKVDQAFQDHQPYECCLRALRRDGTVRVLQSRAQVVFDEDDKPVRMFGTVQDITEQRRAEEAIEESRRRFQAVFENSLDGILLVDNAGRYVDGNPAMCQLLGYSREELLQLTAWDVTPAPDRERISELQGRFLAAGKLSGEYTLLCKDGTTREVEHRAVANMLPGLHLGLHRDITERKQAERALQNRHHLLQAVIEGVPEAIFVKDLHGRYFMINSQAARTVGRAVEEMIGRDDTVLSDPETAQRLRETDRRVIESDESMTFEQVITAAGVTRTYLTTKAPFRSTDGEVVGVLGISRDITKSRALQTERDRLLERVRLQIDRLPLAYIVLDENQHVLNWNPAAEKMFGYTKAEALGRLCLDLIFRHPIDHEVLEVVHRLESGDMHANSVNENYTKDGRIITCHWFNTPLMDPDGNFAGVISLAQDITERRQAEEESRVLNAALENAVEGIARLDEQGRYLAVNRAYAGMLGYRPEELIGMDLQSTVHPKDREKVKAAFQRMLSQGRAETEVLGVRKDDTVFWKQTVIVKAHNQQGHWFAHYCFMKDITERKLAEEALCNSAERLQVLSRRVVEVQEQERGHIARELHDEIGQVLGAISVNLHAVKDVCDAAARPRIEESIQIVDQATQQVRNLSFDLRPSMLDDLGLVATLRWYADRQAQRAGFAVHFAVESSGARLPAELAIACFRVMQEALTNVMRHARARHVWVELRQGDDEVDLVIRDDGVGFDSESAHGRAARGESFGLPGIQERVELLGGRADIQSQPDHGTTIRVWFPMASPPSAQAPSEGSQL